MVEDTDSVSVLPDVLDDRGHRIVLGEIKGNEVLHSLRA
jgi:hypothetical protein